MSEKLLNCPFCGSTAHTEYLNERHPDLYTVKCDNTGCFANKMGFGWKVGMADIIAAWNTRTPDPTTVKVLEAIERLTAGVPFGDDCADTRANMTRNDLELELARCWMLLRENRVLAIAELSRLKGAKE